MNTVHNARITLLATLLNTMAGSSFTVGVAAPIAAVFFYNPTGIRIGSVAVGIVVWIGIAALLHVGAQYTLGRLRT